MSFIYLILSLTLAAVSVGVGAVTLNPIPSLILVAPKIPAKPVAIPCDQITQALQTYQSMDQEAQQSLLGFLGQVSTTVSGWYGQLSPLEGTSNPIAKGTFLPLQTGAQNIATITNEAYSDSNLLVTQMANILTSLGACKIIAAP